MAKMVVVLTTTAEQFQTLLNSSMESCALLSSSKASQFNPFLNSEIPQWSFESEA